MNQPDINIYDGKYQNYWSNGIVAFFGGANGQPGNSRKMCLKLWIKIIDNFYFAPPSDNCVNFMKRKVVQN
jgi:hypothetical protein